LLDDDSLRLLRLREVLSRARVTL
jgi:hypothetical protein